MDAYSFGYPKECEQCQDFSQSRMKLRVAPYYRPGKEFRLMLVGQDPTISRKPERVRYVLMLDQPGSQLSRWLSELLGEENSKQLTLYATNLVKCSFEEKPSNALRGAFHFLQDYFAHCREYLCEELRRFKPTLVMTLGEAAHKHFITLLDNRDKIDSSMKKAFTGKFVKANHGGFEFDYSPCLHITTFRVAETYGEKVRLFKESISSYLRREL